MSNSSIVKYHNDLNNLQMTGFTEKEIDLFFAICLKMKNKSIQELSLTFQELRELIDYKNGNIDRFYKLLDKTYTKILGLNFRYEDVNQIIRFTLFSRFIINKDNQSVTIKINEDFKYILNDFVSMYTLFDIKELVNLKSIYSKNLYKILKQFRNTGWYEVNIETLRYSLDVPESYDTNNFNKRVLAPILEELPKYFLNLRVEKIKKGRKIHKLRFMWDLKTVQEIEVMPKEDVIDEAMQNKINAVKAAISFLDDTEILALLDVADVGVILEKYYTLAVGKNIDNLTGFLMAAIKNDWKKTPKKAEEKKAVQGEMDELERKLQKRLFDKLSNRGN